MKKCLLVGSMLLMIPGMGYAQNESLHGMWRLVGAVTTVIATDETFEPFGPNPHGFITYVPEGRMQVIITADQRPKPSQSAIADMAEAEAKELLRTMVAYSGTYTFDGKTVTHHIEVSWNEVWSGTDQMRDVNFDDGKVTLTTRPGPNPRDGRISTTALTWEKVQ